MGNVCKRRRKKLYGIRGRTFVEVKGIRSPRVADVPTVCSENFAGNANGSTF